MTGTLLRPSLRDVLPQTLGGPLSLREILQRGMPHYVKLLGYWKHNQDTFCVSGTADTDMDGRGRVLVFNVTFSLVRTRSTEFKEKLRRTPTGSVVEFYMERLPYTPDILVRASNRDGRQARLPDHFHSTLQQAARLCLEGALPDDMKPLGSTFTHPREALEAVKVIGDIEDIGSIWRAADLARKVQDILNRDCPVNEYCLKIRPCMARHIILAAEKALIKYHDGTPGK